jgi:hypothetical protein
MSSIRLVFKRDPFEPRPRHGLSLLIKILLDFHNASGQITGHYRYLKLGHDRFIP